jgi:succinoglycan biosynthesis transport protein ExoP
METSGHEVRTLNDYVRVVRRRKWLILSVAVLLPVAALLYSLDRSPLYKASAEVLINRVSPLPDATGLPQGTTNQPERTAMTEANVAAVPAVARQVLREAGITDMTPEEFLAQSSATAEPDADVLVLAVEAADPERAALLATHYAREFTEYRKELDTRAIRAALSGIEARIAELDPERDRTEIAGLRASEGELETAEALATGNTLVIREPTAESATKVRPRPGRAALLGVGLGLLLGVVIAFFRDAMDTRIRSSDEVAERLGAPLLARIPELPRRLHATNTLVMLADPNGTDAEAFRMLRANLDFVNLERKARGIMVTSASEREGKSTTVANLAVALARSGKHVVLVDLDLRRPFLDVLFGLEGKPGVTNVVLDEVTVDDALTTVWAPEPPAAEASPAEATAEAATSTRRPKSTPEEATAEPAASTRARKPKAGSQGNGRAPLSGFLEVLPSGPRPPNPGEFVATRAVGSLLDKLRKRADFVLVDAPPLIGLGDAMTISAKVDGIVVVTRMNLLTRPQAAELHRLLATSPAATLGFVLTGADADEHRYAYGVEAYSMPGAQEERRQKAAERPTRPRRARKPSGRTRSSRTGGT